METKITGKSEADTLLIAGLFAKSTGRQAVVYLNGDLGAGKTTFVRGVMRGLGFLDAVKSPTFTLVEPYELERGQVYHFDLYRLGHPEELEYLGVDDYFNENALCLIEWPEKGSGYLPDSDVVLSIEQGARDPTSQQINRDARQFIFEAKTEVGQKLLRQFNDRLTEEDRQSLA